MELQDSDWSRIRDIYFMLWKTTSQPASRWIRNPTTKTKQTVIKTRLVSSRQQDKLNAQNKMRNAHHKIAIKKNENKRKRETNDKIKSIKCQKYVFEAVRKSSSINTKEGHLACIWFKLLKKTWKAYMRTESNARYQHDRLYKKNTKKSIQYFCY